MKFIKRHLQIKALNVTETQDAGDDPGEAQLEGFGLKTGNFGGKVSFCILLPVHTEKWSFLVAQQGQKGFYEGSQADAEDLIKGSD